jgi:hypothetical protein
MSLHFFLVVVGFELRALHLLARCSTSPFCFGYFQTGSYAFCPGLVWDCYPSTSMSYRKLGSQTSNTKTSLFVEMWSH